MTIKGSAVPSPIIPPPIDLRFARSFTAGALGLGTAALAGPAVRAACGGAIFIGMDGALLWASGVAAALSTVLATAIVMRRGAITRRRGVLRWYAAAGVLAAGLTLFGVAGLQGDLNPLFLLAGALGGGWIGAPLGVLFAVSFAPVLLAWERLRTNPSIAGRIVAVGGAGGWLTAAGLLASLVSSHVVTDLLATTCMVAGATSALGAAAVFTIRKRLIAYVAADRVPGWAIRNAAEIDVPLGLARWTDAPDPSGRQPAILCRVVGANLVEPRVRIPAALLPSGA